MHRIRQNRRFVKNKSSTKRIRTSLTARADFALRLSPKGLLTMPAQHNEVARSQPGHSKKFSPLGPASS